MRKFIVGQETQHPNNRLGRGKVVSMDLHGKTVDLIFLSTDNVVLAKGTGVSQNEMAEQIRTTMDKTLMSMVSQPALTDLEFLILYSDLGIL